MPTPTPPTAGDYYVRRFNEERDNNSFTFTMAGKAGLVPSDAGQIKQCLHSIKAVADKLYSQPDFRALKPEQAIERMCDAMEESVRKLNEGWRTHNKGEEAKWRWKRNNMMILPEGEQLKGHIRFHLTPQEHAEAMKHAAPEVARPIGQNPKIAEALLNMGQIPVGTVPRNSSPVPQQPVKSNAR